MPNEDKELISAFQKGDQNAFRQIYALHYRQLYYFARKMTNRPEDAKDIVSETFLSLWKRCEHFESLTNIKAFLFISARNASVNYLKSEQSQRRKETRYWNISNENIAEMFDIMAAHDILAEVHKEIAKLSEQEKMIVELFYFQGNSIREIADRLNISYEAAKKARFRALARVRAGLREKKFLTVLGLLIPQFF